MTKSELNKLITEHRRAGKAAGFTKGLKGGLVLKVSPKGSATFMMRFIWNGKPAVLKIGDCRYMNEEQARAAVLKCKEWLTEGSDPRLLYKLEGDRPQQSGTYTVADMLNDWIARSRRASIDKTSALLQKHIIPQVGTIHVDSMTVQHWIALLDGIATGKHTGRPAPSVARKLLSDIKAAMQYGRLTQKCSSRAADDIPADFVAPPGKPGDRVLTTDELRDVLRWATQSRAPTYYKTLSRLLVTFGARTAEFRLSELKEWNLDTCIWTVPAAHSKNGNEIVRPIPDSVLPLITDLIRRARAAGSKHILGELKAQSAVSAYMRGIWKRLKHETPWSAHDLRRSMRTHAAELGIMPWIAESLLGHVVGGVEGIYNRAQQITEKRNALVAWTGELNRIERAGVLALAAGGQH